MEDFQNLTNHLIAYALQYRITDVRELRELRKSWFKDNNPNGYASHYLHSACSMAMGTVNGWREAGNARLPHLYRPTMRLDQMLTNVVGIGIDSIKLQITLCPREFITIDLPTINHKSFSKWSKSKLGEITITMDSISLPFHVEKTKVTRVNSKEIIGFDTNIESLDSASSNGKIGKVDLSKVTKIRQQMRDKRESIQKAIPKNLTKQRKVLKKYHDHEHNRVKDIVLKEIAPAISTSCQGIIIKENLKDANKDILKESKKFRKQDKNFRTRLSNWSHRLIWHRVEEIHPYPVLDVYAAGTSSRCPFCGGPVSHPKWSISYCPKCGTFDRNKLSAIAIAHRGLKYLRRAPFPPSVEASLRKQSVLGYEGLTARARHDNRNEAMTGDDPKDFVVECG